MLSDVKSKKKKQPTPKSLKGNLAVEIKGEELIFHKIY